METAFTPLASTLGGVLIGLAAVALMAFNGRIAGATAILAGAILPSGLSDWAWRAAMLGGMFAAPFVYLALTGAAPVIDVPVSTAMLIVGGVIVGVGVTLGSGCTSGHGVCGNARLSARSIIATLTFMVTTGLTVYVIRHVVGG